MGKPDFIGIGAQKAATTWIFRRLSMHDDVYFPNGKEIHFWDRRDQNGRPIERYSAIFSGAQNEHVGGKQGDITPAYLLISDERIRELKELAPDVRLILVARNPVERAISAVLQNFRRRGINPQLCSEEDVRRPLFSNFVTECGLYAKHLNRWFGHFPTESLHVVFNDEIREDPRAAIKGVARHIGIDEGVYDLIDTRLLKGKASPTKEKLTVSDELRRELSELYAEDTHEFERLIGRRVPWIGRSTPNGNSTSARGKDQVSRTGFGSSISTTFFQSPFG